MCLCSSYLFRLLLIVSLIISEQNIKFLLVDQVYTLDYTFNRILILAQPLVFV